MPRLHISPSEDIRTMQAYQGVYQGMIVEDIILYDEYKGKYYTTKSSYDHSVIIDMIDDNDVVEIPKRKYKIGFNLLLDMAYDHIPEEDRHIIDARLKALGL